MVFRILSDIPEMDIYRLGDGHFNERGPGLPRHIAGIIVGAVRRPEAGHGHRDDIFLVPAKHVERLRGHQQGKGRIKSSGNADHSCLRMGVGQTFLQAHGLDRQDLLAALRTGPLVFRHERFLRESSCQLCILMADREGDLTQHPPCGRLERRIFPALTDDPLDIQLRVYDLIVVAFRLLQDRAVLRDDVVAAEDHIRRGLPLACIGVDIARDQTRRLAGDQLPPVGVLADGLVAGRTVHDHGRPLNGRLNAGRYRRPYVLADLRRHDQLLHLFILKKKLRAERHLMTVETDIAGHVRSRRELAHLIELRIVRKKRLRRKAEHPSAVHGRRHIVKLAAHAQRRAHKRQDVLIRRKLRDLHQRVLRRLQKCILRKQIPARIPGHAQFREHDDLRLLLTRLADRLTDLLRIEFHIRNPDIRRSRRNLHKPVSHISLHPGRSKIQFYYVPIHTFFTFLSLSCGPFQKSPQFFYRIIVRCITEMALYFDVFSVVDHGLDLFFPHADDGFFDPLFGAVAGKFRRHGICDLKIQPVQHFGEHFFRCVAVIQHGGHGLDVFDVFFQPVQDRILDKRHDLHDEPARAADRVVSFHEYAKPHRGGNLL